MTKKKTRSSPLSRLECLSKKADVPDLSKLKPHELGVVVVGSLYIFRDIIEGLDPKKADIYDMQVAENKIRQSVIQLLSYFDNDTGGKGGKRKAKRRSRADKKD